MVLTCTVYSNPAKKCQRNVHYYYKLTYRIYYTVGAKIPLFLQCNLTPQYQRV